VTIVERDQEAGYVIFELRDDGKTFGGSMELSRTTDADRRPATRAVIRIADRPGYMSSGMLERLGRKLREELGDPPPPPPEDPAPPAQPRKPRKQE
jgi:hypothetical protein